MLATQPSSLCARVHGAAPVMSAQNSWAHHPAAVWKPHGTREGGLAQVYTRFGRSLGSLQAWPRFLSDGSAEGAPWDHFRALISCAVGESLDLWPLHRLTNNRYAGNTAAPERERLVFPNLCSCVLGSHSPRQPAGRALGEAELVSPDPTPAGLGMFPPWKAGLTPASCCRGGSCKHPPIQMFLCRYL